MIQIGIIGCGTIGSALSKAIEQRFSRVARLKYLSDHHHHQIVRLKSRLTTKSIREVSLRQLIRQSDLIIECASVGAAEVAIPAALKAGKDILALSVGGVLKVKGLTQILKKTKGHLYIPSGAIAGIDGVLGHRIGTIKKVQIITRKPLASLSGSPFFIQNRINARRIKKPTLIFRGNAREAIQHFPQNVNVAATLSLAGIGPHKTQVSVYVSPTYRHNMHDIKLEGTLGRLSVQVMNFPSKENPKTSALAIASAIATLEKIFSPFKIGT